MDHRIFKPLGMLRRLDQGVVLVDGQHILLSGYRQILKAVHRLEREVMLNREYEYVSAIAREGTLSGAALEGISEYWRVRHVGHF